MTPTSFKPAAPPSPALTVQEAAPFFGAVTQSLKRHKRRPEADALAREFGADAHSASHGSLSKDLAHRVARDGLPAELVNELSRSLSLQASVVAELIGLDRTTVRRREAADKPLPAHSSEALLRYAELEALARETFESAQAARDWLVSPHPLLEGESPLQAASTSFGAA
jgi:putative toxin-antitoxin system antitoxin component (TIGR02293 family)